MDNEFKRTAQVDKFWAEFSVEPVQLALPSGVGYTLRAYRMSDEVPEFEREAEETEEGSADGGLVIRVDEGEELPAGRRKVIKSEDKAEDLGEELEEELDEDADASDEDSDEDEAEEAKVPEAEEIPVFLSRRGKLLLFRSPEGLADFVSSDAAHDLTWLPKWEKLAGSMKADRVAPADDDAYELDLVVENLRGGHDAWDAELIISAGEIARDLGHALKLEAVQAAMAPGSPLDDLDEALRKTAEGGVGGFFAKRKAKKIGAEQAALAWRTIIGKISAVTDWRD
ncbi:hypothetical protein [Longispora albida]|uniref:hypothetical protein n=1 Tax=Longispora albida TaxID=203523 RepID=UPI00036D22F6|nr:hypothetical protein [Longispora albida]